MGTGALSGSTTIRASGLGGEVPVLTYGGVLTGDKTNLSLENAASFRPGTDFDTDTPGIIKLVVVGENVTWTKPFTRTLDESNAPFYKWFDDGELNASANCLDKHMGTPVENKTAVIFEADDGVVTKTSYKELLAKVSQFANALKANGIQKGDRVLVYMPMTLEGVIAMQACARIGATHSVVFGGFSAKALQERIIDAGERLSEHAAGDGGEQQRYCAGQGKEAQRGPPDGNSR